MVFAAPEFVIAKRIELLDEIEIPAELQHRVLADRVMRGEEGPEFETSHFLGSHGFSPGCSPDSSSWLPLKLWGGNDQGNRLFGTLLRRPSGQSKIRRIEASRRIYTPCPIR
jgi:hypothetical protein